MALVAIAVSYLVASVSFPYWIARAKGVDLRATGARKLGGSNLAKTVGPLHGTVGGLLDAAKGFAAVLIARELALPPETQLLCGLAAIAGQMWPVFHQFDGGRANATTWGFQLATDVIAFFVAWVSVVVGAALRMTLRPKRMRAVPLANLLSFAVFPMLITARDGLTPTALAGFGALVLILARRMTAGLREDLATGAPATRVLANRALFDRSELQERGLVAL